MRFLIILKSISRARELSLAVKSRRGSKMIFGKNSFVSKLSKSKKGSGGIFSFGADNLTDEEREEIDREEEEFDRKVKERLSRKKKLGSEDYPPKSGFSDDQEEEPSNDQDSDGSILKVDAGAAGEPRDEKDRILNIPVELQPGPSPNLFGPYSIGKDEDRIAHVKPPGDVKPIMDSFQEAYEEERENEKEEDDEILEEEGFGDEGASDVDMDDDEDVDIDLDNVKPEEDAGLPLPKNVDEVAWNSLSHEKQLEYHGLLNEFNEAIDNHDYNLVKKLTSKLKKIQSHMSDISSALNIDIPEPMPEEPMQPEDAPEEVDMEKSISQLINQSLLKALYQPGHIGRPNALFGRANLGRYHVNPQLEKQQNQGVDSGRGLPIGTVHYWNIGGKKVPHRKVGPGEWEEVKDHQPSENKVEGDEEGGSVHFDGNEVKFKHSDFADYTSEKIQELLGDDGKPDPEKFYKFLKDHFKENPSDAEQGKFISRKYHKESGHDRGGYHYEISSEPDTDSKTGKGLFNDLFRKYELGLFSNVDSSRGGAQRFIEEEVGFDFHKIEIPDELYNDPDLATKAKEAGGKAGAHVGLYRMVLDHILQNGSEAPEDPDQPDLSDVMWSEFDPVSNQEMIYIHSHYKGEGKPLNSPYDLYRIRISDEDKDKIDNEFNGKALEWARQELLDNVEGIKLVKNKFDDSKFVKMPLHRYFKEREEGDKGHLRVDVGGHDCVVTYDPGSVGSRNQYLYQVRVEDVTDVAGKDFLRDLVAFSRTGSSNVSDSRGGVISFETRDSLVRFLNVADAFQKMMDGNSSTPFKMDAPFIPESRLQDAKFDENKFVKNYEMVHLIESGEMPYKLEVHKIVEPVEEFAGAVSNDGYLNMSDDAGVAYLAYSLGVPATEIKDLVSEWSSLSKPEKAKNPIESFLSEKLGFEGLQGSDSLEQLDNEKFKGRLVLSSKNAILNERKTQRKEEALRREGGSAKKLDQKERKKYRIKRVVNMVPSLTKQEESKLMAELDPIISNVAGAYGRYMARVSGQSGMKVDKGELYLDAYQQALKCLTLRMGGGHSGGFLPFDSNSNDIHNDESHKFKKGDFLSFFKSQFYTEKGKVNTSSPIFQKVFRERFGDTLQPVVMTSDGAQVVNEKRLYAPVYKEHWEDFFMADWKSGAIDAISGSMADANMSQEQRTAVLAALTARLDTVKNIRDAKAFVKSAKHEGVGARLLYPTRSVTVADFKKRIKSFEKRHSGVMDKEELKEKLFEARNYLSSYVRAEMEDAGHATDYGSSGSSSDSYGSSDDGSGDDRGSYGNDEDLSDVSGSSQESYGPQEMVASSGSSYAEDTSYGQASNAYQNLPDGPAALGAFQDLVSKDGNLSALDSFANKDFFSRMPTSSVDEDFHNAHSFMKNFSERLREQGKSDLLKDLDANFQHSINLKEIPDRLYIGNDLGAEMGAYMQELQEAVSNASNDVERDDLLARIPSQEGLRSFVSAVVEGRSYIPDILGSFAEALGVDGSKGVSEFGGVHRHLKDEFEDELENPLIEDLIEHLSGHFGLGIAKKMGNRNMVSKSIEDGLIKSIISTLNNPAFEEFKDHKTYKSIIRSLVELRSEDVLDYVPDRISKSGSLKNRVVKALVEEIKSENLSKSFITDISKEFGVSESDVSDWSFELVNDNLFKSVSWFLASQAYEDRADRMNKLGANFAIMSFEDDIS
jgi:hypothetical protein